MFMRPNTCDIWLIFLGNANDFSDKYCAFAIFSMSVISRCEVTCL